MRPAKKFVIDLRCCSALLLCLALFGSASVDRCKGETPSLDAAIASGDFAGYAESLRKSVLNAYDKAAGNGSLSTMVCEPKILSSIEQYELIRRVGEAKFAELARKDKGADLLRRFLSDQPWMESFLTSDPPTDRCYQGSPTYAQALGNLLILHQHVKDMDKPVYRRLATAIAQQSQLSPYLMVMRFNDIQAAHRQGLLHASFDHLDVRAMRWATDLWGWGGRREYQYALDARQQKIGDYMGTCWAVAWLDFNVYGDWLQGPFFYAPWAHFFGHCEAPFILGGQCENLSLYACTMAKAHGVPVSPVGQPGHCAYVVRIGEHWPIAYDCFGPGATGFTMPGWEGTGYVTSNALVEPVQKDRARFLAATRLAMLAHIVRDRNAPNVSFVPGMSYSLYKCDNGGHLPDFSKLTPTAKGTASAIDLDSVRPNPPSNFAVVWNGQIEAAASKTEKISVTLRSDDQSRLCLDGKQILDLSCTQQSKEVELSPGRHALRLEYCQAGGDFYLNLHFSGQKQLGPWQEVYAEAIRAQPLNYPVWLDYFKSLEEVPNVHGATWLGLQNQVVEAFRCYPDAGWALVYRAIQKAFPAMTTAERVITLVECHKALRQTASSQIFGFRFDCVLSWQDDQIPEPAAKLRFFSQLLDIHAAAAPNDQLFATLIGWGQNRLGKDNPATSPLFAKAMGDYFRKQGEKANKDMMRDQVHNGIRNSAERGNLEAARLWMGLGRDLLPRLTPGDVLLSNEQAAKAPKIEPFSGQLLSADGMLRPSSFSGDDRPLSYRAVLTGGDVGGIVHTNGEAAPWAQVQLPGKGRLSGIVLVNRFENDSFAKRQVPLKVSVSTDGNKWTEVAAFDKPEPAFRVDLKGKNIEASFVRAERVAMPGCNEPFHLREFLIYGQKLY
jgi:hypothetical protein